MEKEFEEDCASDRPLETKEELNSDNNLQENEDKQKTPMCTIHELARFHKLDIKYVLENEVGPAHKKKFYVRLRLCDGEEYSAEGTSIKKAQQAAAKQALEKTKYTMPSKNKPNTTEKYKNALDNRFNGSANRKATPITRLNAMACKLGFQPIRYNIHDKNLNFGFNSAFHFRSFYNYNSTTNEF
jgi:double-stranded RNA-binding protein Staufen